MTPAGMWRRFTYWLSTLPWSWRCCDWCDHGRCTIDPRTCRRMCPHIACGVSCGSIDWPDAAI